MEVKNCKNCQFAIKARDVMSSQRVCIRINVAVDVDHYCKKYDKKENIGNLK